MDLCAPKPPRALERKGTLNRATTVPQQVTVLAHTATSLRAFACPRSEEQRFTKRILLWILCPGRALEAVDRRDTHPCHHDFLLILLGDRVMLLESEEPGATRLSPVPLLLDPRDVHPVDVKRHGL